MAEQEKKPKPTWGQNQAAYLFGLRGKEITVVFPDGKALKGKLAGVGTYELFITQDSGLEIMVQKSAVKYIHRATANG